MQISTENCSSDADLRQSAAAQSESVDIIDFARAPSGTDAKHSYKTPTDNSKITCEVSGCNRRLKKAYHKVRRRANDIELHHRVVPTYCSATCRFFYVLNLFYRSVLAEMPAVPPAHEEL